MLVFKLAKLDWLNHPRKLFCTSDQKNTFLSLRYRNGFNDETHTCKNNPKRLPLWIRVARWFIFKQKIPIWVKF
jgi:hypothetical protein